MTAELATPLLEWYRREGRILPWRSNPQPYQVWVSEIMLQQTRVETVMPYYQRWLELFPSIITLAQAGIQEILSAWEGLGYYSRARAMHKTAQILVNEHKGVIPDDPDTLKRLPGIGPYTAAAILSIAFHHDIPAIDGNIRRVYSRLFDLAAPLKSPESENLIKKAACENLPPGQAGDYNQALMDLGAGICLPTHPRCDLCPLSQSCLARERNVQEQRPVIIPKEAVPFYLVTAAVIQTDGNVLIARRPEKGLLGGMWEFPGGKVETGESLPNALVREIEEELGVQIAVGQPCGVFRHAYTHFRIELHAFSCGILSGDPQPLQASEVRWVDPAELSKFPMGKVDRLISRKLQMGIE
ncbi:MAG: A/G-specific adenine glycosylase [Anaerolineaceae bacterium]